MIANDSGTSGTQWWRWPLVPIAAVVGGLASSLFFWLVHWLGMKLQGGYSEDGWLYYHLLPIVTSVAFGWFFVRITCAVAPRGKVIAGVVMTTLLLVAGIAKLIFIWKLQHYDASEAVRLTIASLAGYVAAIVALVKVHSAHRE
jgi:hypothetical protein